MEPVFRNGLLDEYLEGARRTALNDVDNATPDYLGKHGLSARTQP